MPTRGKSARQAGHQWERDCANTLTKHLQIPIITTRSIGANYGADLCRITGYDNEGRPAETTSVILGWAIECKNTGAWEPAKWMRQAEGQKVQGSKPLVLAKRRNCPTLEAWAILNDPDYGMIQTTLRQWLKRWSPDSGQSPE